MSNDFSASFGPITMASIAGGYIPNKNSTGWSCPRCNTVYSPDVKVCEKCSKVESSDLGGPQCLME